MKARYLIPLLILIFSVTSINAFAQANAAALYEEKMGELDWMIGTWKFDYTLEQNGEALSLEVECTWALHESLIQCDRLNEGGHIMNRTLYSYDSFSSRYVVNIFDGRGHVAHGEMVKEGNNWNVSTSGFLAGREGKTTLVVQEQHTMKSDSNLDVVRYASIDASPPTKLYEGKMTKGD